MLKYWPACACGERDSHNVEYFMEHSRDGMLVDRTFLPPRGNAFAFRSGSAQNLYIFKAEIPISPHFGKALPSPLVRAFSVWHYWYIGLDNSLLEDGGLASAVKDVLQHLWALPS